MGPVLIYFKETHLNENNKFTLDFSDHKFVQETEFLSENKYYIATLNCKLKVEEYIYETKKIKDLYSKSRVLLEKGPTVLCDIDYLTLKSEWYLKASNYVYHFILNPIIIDNYSYRYKFWDKIEKKLGMDKSTRHILNLLEKVLILKKKL